MGALVYIYIIRVDISFFFSRKKEIFSNKSPPFGTKDYLRGWKKFFVTEARDLSDGILFGYREKELDEGGGEWGGGTYVYKAKLMINLSATTTGTG